MNKKLVAAGLGFCVALSSVFFTGCQPQEEQSSMSSTADMPQESTNQRVLDLPGTYSDKEEYEMLTIAAGDVVVENATADELIIAASVGDGDVTLRACQVQQLTILGGGRESIHLEGTTVGTLTSAREEDAVRIVVDAASTVENLTLEKETILEVEGSVQTLNIKREAQSSVITEEGGITSVVREEPLPETTVQLPVNTVTTPPAQPAAPQPPAQQPVQEEQSSSAASQPESSKPQRPSDDDDDDDYDYTPSPSYSISRISAVPGKVTVTLNRATSKPVPLEDISILCNTGGSDMTILRVSTKDNKVYELTTSYYKDNEYELYMTLPNGKIISKVFELRTTGPEISEVKAVRINKSSADFLFVSDQLGTFYYLVEESADPAAAAAENALSAAAKSTVPTPAEMKASGTLFTMEKRDNILRINGLQPDTAYDLYFMAISTEGEETLVQGPVQIDATPKQEPEKNAVQITAATATDTYFDITLSQAAPEELRLEQFSISCPSESALHLGRLEKLSETQYRLHMKTGYFFRDMNHYTVVITYSDNTVSEYTFFVDLSWPKLSLPTIIRRSETEAEFTFRVDEDGKLWYLIGEDEEKPTIDTVIKTGKEISFKAGANEFDLEGNTANSTYLYYVSEDLLGNRPDFVDRQAVPKESTPENPTPPTSSEEIKSITTVKGSIPIGECTVVKVECSEGFFDYHFVSADDITIKQVGSSSFYNGSRDLQTEMSGSTISIYIRKSNATILPAGEYTITMIIDDGSQLSGNFTVE